jgi:hypothetical protein
MFCVSNPVASRAGARGFVMSQVFVQCLDEFDAFTQRTAQDFGRHVIEVPEILHAGLPAATLTGTVIAPFTGGFKHVLVVVVVVVDQLLEQQAGIHQRFYELLSHRFLLSSMVSDYAY